MFISWRWQDVTCHRYQKCHINVFQCEYLFTELWGQITLGLFLTGLLLYTVSPVTRMIQFFLIYGWYCLLCRVSILITILLKVFPLDMTGTLRSNNEDNNVNEQSKEQKYHNSLARFRERHFLWLDWHVLTVDTPSCSAVGVTRSCFRRPLVSLITSIYLYVVEPAGLSSATRNTGPDSYRRRFRKLKN